MAKTVERLNSSGLKVSSNVQLFNSLSCPKDFWVCHMLYPSQAVALLLCIKPSLIKLFLGVSKKYLIFCKALIKRAFIMLKETHEAMSKQYETEKLYR